MFICDKCEGSNVQMQMWVRINTNEVIDDANDELNWCEDCEEHVTLTEVEAK
jgi:hypothetical protein